ncbi:MAG TPA: hypothetical protein VI138_06220 [Candidatus Dormibacteraeota bacterium]
MDNLRISDNLNGEALVALGLPAPRLVLAGLGAMGIWALAELPLPAGVRLVVASLLGVSTALLAWGKAEGVSLARWAWLALGYLCRSIGASQRRPPQWFAAERAPEVLRSDPRPGWGWTMVAFLGIRPLVGCTTVFRAVAAHLERTRPELGIGGLEDLTPEWPGARERGHRPRLADWGTSSSRTTKANELAAVVLVWDGRERFVGELADRATAIQRELPGVPALVVLNRSGPAVDLAAQIAEVGGRLISTVPFDPTLADAIRPFDPSTWSPAAGGVQAAASAVLAVFATW